MTSLDQAIKRELRAAILRAMHTAIGCGMEVAEVADCLEDLNHSLLNGNWINEEP